MDEVVIGREVLSVRMTLVEVVVMTGVDEVVGRVDVVVGLGVVVVVTRRH